MAQFKMVDMSPRFLPVVLEQQLAPGTFEYALHILIDSEFDLLALAAKFKNHETGAPACDPAVMLKTRPWTAKWSLPSRSNSSA